MEAMKAMDILWLWISTLWLWKGLATVSILYAWLCHQHCKHNATKCGHNYLQLIWIFSNITIHLIYAITFYTMQTTISWSVAPCTIKIFLFTTHSGCCSGKHSTSKERQRQKRTNKTTTIKLNQWCAVVILAP